MVRDFKKGDKWVPGVNITKVGTINLEVAKELKWKRQSDHIIKKWGTDFLEKGDNVSLFLWTCPQRYHVERPQAVFEPPSAELPAPCYPARTRLV